MDATEACADLAQGKGGGGGRAAKPRATLSTKAPRRKDKDGAAQLRTFRLRITISFMTACGSENSGRQTVSLISSANFAVYFATYSNHPKSSNLHGQRQPVPTPSAKKKKTDLNMMNRRRSMSVSPSLPSAPPVANHMCKPLPSSPALGSQFSAFARS